MGIPQRTRRRRAYPQAALARSVPDARAIGDDLAARGIKLSIGGQVYDPADPMGKMFFNILATFAEFEVDLLRMRTRESMAVARAKGKLRGKQPKLSARQQRELARMVATGEYTIADLAEVFTVSRATGSPRQVWRPLCLRTVFYLTRFQCLIMDFLVLFRRHIAAV